jgi:YcaO-like protein with predicted kinase domain
VAMEGCRNLHEVVQPFQSGSNGLSAGNTFLEAVEGGLLEVVERDAAACRRLAWDRYGRSIPRVRLETITHPLVLELLERFERTGVAVVLFDCTIDTAIPVYLSYLYDRQSRHIGIYGGCGAHLDPGIAMVRALTEAVQSRLIFIAGSRDDFFRHSYLRLKHDDDAATIARLEAIPALVDARHTVSSATPTFEGDIHVILERLRAAGLTQALVYDLTLPGFDVSAVRVIVPGLEGYLFSSYAPGRRALAFLKECRQ